MNPRLFKKLLIGALVITGIVLCPWLVNVTTEFVLFDGNRAVIHAESQGFIRQIDVKTGDAVKNGQVLAVLENDELEAKRDDVTDSLASNFIQRREAVAAGDGGAMGQARVAFGDLLAAKAKLDHACDSLVLRSTTDGIIGTDDIQNRKGDYMQAGDVFCEVIPEQRLKVRIALNERDAGLVRVGQTLEFRTYAFPDRVFDGTVSKVFSAVSDSLPSDAMAARAGGDVPTALDSTGHERPLLPTFQAELEIANPDGLLRPGMSGRGKIRCEHTRLGIEVCRRASEFVKSLL
jgi:multidrug resistance efflux pump